MLPSRNSGCKITHFFGNGKQICHFSFMKAQKSYIFVLVLRIILYFCTNHEHTTIYIDSYL